MKFLLDYFFKITAINPTPAASTAFLKQVMVVVSPKMGVTPGEIVMVTSKIAAAAVTDNADVGSLFDAGMSRVYLLPMNDLDLSAIDFTDVFTVLISSDFDDEDIVATAASGNITITSYANLISGTPDTVAVAGQVFTAQAGAATLGTATFQAATSNNATATSLAAQINAHAATKDKVLAVANGAIVTITAKQSGVGGNALALAYTDNDANVGATKSGTVLTGGDGLFLGDFEGVTGFTSDDDDFLAEQNAIENRCGFYGDGSHGAKNLFFAFGKLLSNSLDWKNQQFITMPYADGAADLGSAEAFFDDKISFVITDDQYGSRLGLFTAGGKPIATPYIQRNLEVDLQSKALQYVSANQPGYTHTHAALLEDELQKVIDGDGQPNGNPGYVGRGWVVSGDVSITLEQDDFVAAGRINYNAAGALWRIAGQITQS